jgi:hypothetical protein
MFSVTKSEVQATLPKRFAELLMLRQTLSTLRRQIRLRQSSSVAVFHLLRRLSRLTFIASAFAIALTSGFVIKKS